MDISSWLAGWRSPDQKKRRCFIIAEVAQNHDGSLGTAHAYIDAVAKTGVDAVKFQTHIADAESTAAEPWRVKFSRQDATRFDYWKRMEFTPEQWLGLAQHADSSQLVFLSSAFSNEAVELLDGIGVSAWKVGAGEIRNLPMIEKMAATAKPVFLSSGMSSWNELDSAVEVVRRHGAPVAVLQCTTQYPCAPEKLGLNVIAQFRERYGCPVGLSDHTGTIYSALGAIALGADILEAHVVFSKECYGPDVAASITTSELQTVVTGARFLEQALANPVDKETVAHEMGELRGIFGKSVVAARDLPAGTMLRPGDLALKKPGTGLSPEQIGKIIGLRLKHSLSVNSFLKEEDVEQPEAS